MKLWQVQGKDLREVNGQALSDEQRVQDWLAKGTSHDDKSAWIVDHPKPAPDMGGKSNGQQKSPPPPSNRFAFQEARAQAEDGDAAAQAALGFMLELGIDAPVDGAEAVKWYRKAAEQGNARGKSNLGLIAARGFIYEAGKHAPADGAQAVEWCRKEAEQGNARAQYNLGQMYEWGNGVPKNPAKAVKWYHEAAEQGEPAAEYKLGLCYCNGHGVPQNTAEAVRWWTQAAEQGDAAAQYKLGLCYCNAQGVPQDYAEAVKWYLKAAEQGESLAQAKLGDAFYIGVGVASNHAEAVRWYLEAAEQGEGAAQRHLGIMYGLGQGVPKDYTEAYKWYTLAAAQHDTNAVHNRDTITDSMTPAQIAKGRQLAQEFLARRRGGVSNRGNGKLAVVAAPPMQARGNNSSQTGVPAGGASLFGLDVLLVGKQVATDAAGNIDLLGIDAQANLVLLELKREKAPHEIVAQTLDHASWVTDLSHEQIDAMTQSFIGKPLAQAFSDHFGHPIPKTVNASHSIIILASEWDDSSERIMHYLAKKHGVRMQVLFMALFKTASGEFLGRVAA
jgi:uncharacterized protein